MSKFVQKMITRGRNEGITIGRNEGISFATDRMTKLMNTLYSQGRDNDVKKAFSDKLYLQKLFEE